MARISKVDKQLDALAARFTPKIKKAFLASVADIKDKAVIGAIVDAITVGDLEAAFRATGLSAAAMRPITSMIETAFEQGGVTVANSAPRGITDGFGNRAVFRFDVRNSRSEAWLRDHSSSLVTRITDDTRGNIRTIIQRGVADGRNPRNIALDIVGRVNPDTGRRSGGIIGLTGPQETWVANARRDLSGVPSAHYFTREQRDKRFDSIVRKAIDTKTPLSGAKVDALVDKYSDNLLLQRGETIARTEAMQSLNKAADDAFRQAIDEGTLKPNAVTKTWDSAGDNRVRESHKAMDGQAVQMDEPFKSPDGAQLMYPGDTSLGAPAREIIDCRCRVRHAVDWFADLDDDDEAPPAPAPRPVPPVPPLPPIPRVPEPAPAPVSVIADAKTFEDFQRQVTPDDREWRKGWTGSEREEIEGYINSSQINRDLRSGNPGQNSLGSAQILDALIDRAPVFERDTYVYRSVDIRNFPAKVGDTYVDEGFVSASVAEFSQNIWEKFYGEQARLRILIPKGTPKALIERMLDDPDNNMTEVLLPRGATFTITENSRNYLEVELKEWRKSPSVTANVSNNPEPLPLNPSPNPPPIPANRFAYETFQPVRSITEAEEWANKFLAENVSFTKGVKLPGLNAILQASQEVIERFNMPKMRYMGDPKGDASVAWKFPPKAVATFGMKRDTFLFRNFAADEAKIFEGMASSEAKKLENLRIARANTAPWLHPDVRAGLQRMTGIDWAVSQNSKGITYHEMGHRFDSFHKETLRKLQQTETGYVSWIQEGWPYLVSRYSATNIEEYIAETFSLYMQGDESQFWRIHPKLLAYYQSQDRKNVSN